MLNQIETFTQLTYGSLIGTSFIIGSILISIAVLSNMIDVIKLNVTLKPTTKTIYIFGIVLSLGLTVAGLYLVLNYS